MQKHFIWIIILFVTSPIFSQTDINHNIQTYQKSLDSIFKNLPESIRDKLHLPNTNIENQIEMEPVNIVGSVPYKFFTNMMVGDSGLTVTYNYHRWDTQGQEWNSDPYRREIYKYDSSGNEIEYLYQYWDGTNWVNSIHYISTYDMDDNLIELLDLDWDGAGWVKDWRELYTYDSSGNLTEGLRQDWDGTDWVIRWHWNYTYDLNGNLTEGIGQSWDGVSWVNTARILLTYDLNGNWTELLGQSWDEADWVNNFLWLHTYDLNGNLTEALYQDWDGFDWINIERDLNTYDANGNQTEKLNQYWIGTDLVNFSLNYYTYDSNGNLTEDYRQYWDETEWVNSSLQLYAYDSNENLTEKLHQSWDGIDWVNSSIIYIDYTNVVISTKSEVIPIVYSLKQNYPNPFNPTTILEYSIPKSEGVSLIVYSLLGEEVVRLVNGRLDAGFHRVSWNASNMASGIYFYRLQAGDFVRTRKMVLLK